MSQNLHEPYEHIRFLCCALPHTVWPHNQAIQWEMLIKSRCLCMLSHPVCLSHVHLPIRPLTHICNNVLCYIFPFPSFISPQCTQTALKTPGLVFHPAASFPGSAQILYSFESHMLSNILSDFLELQLSSMRFLEHGILKQLDFVHLWCAFHAHPTMRRLTAAQILYIDIGALCIQFFLVHVGLP